MPVIAVIVVFSVMGLILWIVLQQTRPQDEVSEEETPKEAKEVSSEPAKSEVVLAKEPSRAPRPLFSKALASWRALLKTNSKDRAHWEQVLIESDLGPRLTSQILDAMAASNETAETFLKKHLANLIKDAEVQTTPWLEKKPWILFLVGVNGVGKTTSLVKLARFFGQQGKSVGVIGADTFRKAAMEQLERGILKVGGEFFTLQSPEGSEGADPAAVVFDGLKKFAIKDIVLVDTSGRLHTKKNLMEELKKMVRVASKAHEGAPHDTWIIMDATLGQNVVAQAKSFHEAVGLTGLLLTKVDGLSRGGTIFQLFQELHVPIRFLGLGERPEDLEIFKSDKFIEDLFDQSTSSS